MESGDVPKHYFVPIVSSAAGVGGRTVSIEYLLVHVLILLIGLYIDGCGQVKRDHEELLVSRAPKSCVRLV